ncbi:MAG TPA: hypothetical protein VFI47_11230, partial [Acidimicrobiales bacterium]|nr:hypothetical protein [Acidimicrobiales bacterium]
LLVLVGLSALIATGPGGCGLSRDGDPPAGMPPPGQSVLLTAGVRYATAPEGWADPTLDLYLPTGDTEPPVAVIVPDAGAGPSDPAGPADPSDTEYVDLARGLASAGVATVVVAWGVESPELTAVAGRSVEDLVEQTGQTTAEISCALRVAAARVGPRVGTRARPLVVVGHGAGANVAAMAVLSTPRPFATCFAGGDPPPVTAAVLWGGDWLGAVADDALGARVAPFLAAHSPWPGVDSLATSTYLELGVNANRLVGRSVETWPTSSYVTTRDPTGAITDDLQRVGAFDDGRLDLVDATRAFAVGLRDAGIQSRERELHGEGDPDTLGPRVRALVVQSVVQLTRP